MDTYSDTKPCPMPPTAYREKGKPTNGSLSIVIGLLMEKNKVLWEMDNLSRVPNFTGGLARFPLLHPLIYYADHLLLLSHFSYEPNKILQRRTGIQIEPICYPPLDFVSRTTGFPYGTILNGWFPATNWPLFCLNSHWSQLRWVPKYQHRPQNTVCYQDPFPGVKDSFPQLPGELPAANLQLQILFENCPNEPAWIQWLVQAGLWSSSFFTSTRDNWKESSSFIAPQGVGKGFFQNASHPNFSISSILISLSLNRY